MKVCGGLMEQGVVGPHIRPSSMRETTFLSSGLFARRAPGKVRCIWMQSDWQPPRDLSQRQSSNLNILYFCCRQHLGKRSEREVSGASCIDRATGSQQLVSEVPRKCVHLCHLASELTIWGRTRNNPSKSCWEPFDCHQQNTKI